MVEDYRYICIAEICRVLSFFIVVDYILAKYPHFSAQLSFAIGSDYQIVINEL